MDEYMEVNCAAMPVPAGLSEEVKGYSWARNNVGESGEWYIGSTARQVHPISS